MAYQPIDHGNAAGDGQGETLFSAFQKVNANDAELFGGKTVFVASYAALPATGEALKIYVTLDTGRLFCWTGAAYSVISLAAFDVPIKNALMSLDQAISPVDLAKISTAWKLSSVPTPYAPAHVLHPSVWLFDNGWRGYRYWMAYTPYPNSDSEFENPCVAASNDGEAWVAIGAQPLVPSPAGAGTYNSDPDLYYDDLNDRLVMVFRESLAAGVMNLKVMTCTDGINWSAPTIIYTGTGVATSGATDIASPSIWYNPSASKWEIVGHNLKTNADAWPFVKITSSNLLSGWDTVFTTLTFDVPAAGRKWWHSQFRRAGDGKIIGVVQDNSGSVGNAGNLYIVRSDDGLNFYSGLLDNSKSWYRPSFVIVKGTDRNPVPYLKIFGSGLATSGIWTARAELNIGNSPVKVTGNTGDTYYDSDEGVSLGTLFGLARAGARGILIADDFNRADSAAGVGNSIDNKVWTQLGGADLIGISGNRAYNVTAGNCRIFNDVGAGDHLTRFTIAAKGGETYAMVRRVDSNNFIRIGVPSSSGQLAYRVVIGGAQVIDEALGATALAGDEIKVLCRGEFILIWLRGSLVGIKRQTSLKAGTGVGLQMSGTTSYIDNFVCSRLY